MPELWDAYDKDFNKLENITLVRGEPVPDGIYHLVCEILVKHTDGTYLLMQRDLNKKRGGRWELSAGGSVLKDENPYDGAIRELREETGIIASDLTEIQRTLHGGHHSYYVIYLCLTDCAKDSVTLQEGETIDYKWVTREELLGISSEVLASSRTIALVKERDL